MKKYWQGLWMNGNNSYPLLSRILYQNETCVAVNKLKGEAVEGAKAGMINLPEELSRILGANVDLIEAVHRLDVPVTGCALFALTKNALTFLNAAFAEENSPIEKIYWAIIEKPSKPLSPTGTLIHWIETNQSKNKSFAYKEDAPGRKKAVLNYKIIGEGTNYLFIEIQLISGRHHQIRAQFAEAGLHIKGDLKYGSKRSEKTGGIRLHARSLSFPNPQNKTEKITITADPPFDNLWLAYINR
jgi:23S rRNA pseudouridine1911/1915/1917 synthase